MTIEELRNKFPLEYNNGITLYLDDILEYRNYEWYITFHDNENYKYQSTYHHIASAKSNNYVLNRFFKRNPFTYYNINNFCRLNNIDLYIDGKHLPVTGFAREKLNFIDSNNNIAKVSWNDIQSYPERYRKDYNEILKKRKEKRCISKEEAAKDILDMQSKLNRPLMCYDFYPKQEGHIGIRTIRKYWKEFWLMQKDLGLVITGKHGSKLSDEDCLVEIKNICEIVFKNENRKIITYDDIRKHGTYGDMRRYLEVCKYNGYTLRKYIKLLGYELQKAGNGMNVVFNNGEKVVSKYEYEFSNFLKGNGLEYNKDYFRNVKYQTLTTTYKGNMNCDYEIHFQGRIFYVELAGILGNIGHEKCYKENKPINSKSKEKYRLGLMKKKEIFEKERLEHYILLKSEMHEDTYKKILYKSKIEVI